MMPDQQDQHQDDDAQVGLGHQQQRHGTARRAPAPTCAQPGAASARSTQLAEDRASIRIIPILAYSDGSTWNPPGSEIQECAPLTMVPSGVSTASRPRQAAT